MAFQTGSPCWQGGVNYQTLLAFHNGRISIVRSSNWGAVLKYKSPILRVKQEGVSPKCAVAITVTWLELHQSMSPRCYFCILSLSARRNIILRSNLVLLNIYCLQEWNIRTTNRQILKDNLHTVQVASVQP